jgi:hypothetical protein
MWGNAARHGGWVVYLAGELHQEKYAVRLLVEHGGSLVVGFAEYRSQR